MSEVTVDAATQAFLDRQTNLILATIRKDGTPQVSPLWYLWTKGTFVLSTNDKTAKWWNLQRDPRCSVCVDDPESGQMVVGYGVAELDGGDVWDRTWELVAKYRKPEDVQGHMDRIFRQRRVLITVLPDRLITRQL